MIIEEFLYVDDLAKYTNSYRKNVSSLINVGSSEEISIKLILIKKVVGWAIKF